MLKEKLIADTESESSFTLGSFGGQRTIGFWSGVNLLSNNICGPAIVLLPALFQQAGIIPTTIALIIITILAGISSWMLIESMKLIPANEDLNHRYEYMAVAYRHLSRPHYWIVFVFYQISTMSLLISNIIQTAQVFDIAIADLFGCSYGFAYYPNFGQFPCGNDLSHNVEPWDTDWVISIGLLVVAFISIPFGLLNLDDNIISQWIAVIGFVVMAVIWIVVFTEQPTWNGDNVPWATTNLSKLVGVILFNYGFIVTLPSWVNEKKTKVSTTRTLVVSLGFMFTVFYVVGIVGAFAYHPYYMTNEDIFDQLTNSKGHLALTAKITVYLEPIIQNVTSIPIFSIVIRYNLLDADFSNWTANFWSIIFPWAMAIPLYNGNGFNDLCNWTGIILAAYVNFIVSPYLFILALVENRAVYRIPNNQLRSASASFDVTMTDPVFNEHFDGIHSNINGLSRESIGNTSSRHTPSRRRSTRIQVHEDEENDMTGTGTMDSDRLRIGTHSVPSYRRPITPRNAPRLRSYDVELLFMQKELKKERRRWIMGWIAYVTMWIVSLIGIFFTLYDQFCDPHQDTWGLCQKASNK